MRHAALVGRREMPDPAHFQEPALHVGQHRGLRCIVLGASFETRSAFAIALLRMRDILEGTKKFLILRSPHSGRLEGRTPPIQLGAGRLPIASVGSYDATPRSRRGAWPKQAPSRSAPKPCWRR